MYSVNLGYNAAINRINALIADGYHAESLLTAMFTVEKTLRRTLKQIIISAGFKNTTANKILDRTRGFDAITKVWEIYDPHGRKLSSLISQTDWNDLERVSKKRNNLVHGIRIYDLAECQIETQKVLSALQNLISVFNTVYQYDGWSKIAVRKKSVLHSNPKIKI